MGKKTGVFIFFFSTLLLLTCLYPGLSIANVVDIQFKEERVTANLIGVSLLSVLKEVNKEKEIWFEGEESLLHEKISVQFKDLCLENALSRIFAGTNHILVFDGNNAIIGIIAVSNKKHRSRSAIQSRDEDTRLDEFDSENEFILSEEEGHSGRGDNLLEGFGEDPEMYALKEQAPEYEQERPTHYGNDLLFKDLTSDPFMQTENNMPLEEFISIELEEEM